MEALHGLATSTEGGRKFSVQIGSPARTKPGTARTRSMFKRNGRGRGSAYFDKVDFEYLRGYNMTVLETITLSEQTAQDPSRD